MMSLTFMINVMPEAFFWHGEEILLSLRQIARFSGNCGLSKKLTTCGFPSTAIKAGTGYLIAALKDKRF
ncbi:hypothetical protein AB1E22_03260 [Buttiauxella gaviniae]|uniref:Uncharacterized protein n=1 Tax=Buttiauxella gaviniae TaxID=82990 RepID=A0ABV3NQC6_9ENTR